MHFRKPEITKLLALFKLEKKKKKKKNAKKVHKTLRATLHCLVINCFCYYLQ